MLTKESFICPVNINIKKWYFFFRKKDLQVKVFKKFQKQNESYNFNFWAELDLNQRRN